MAAPTYVTHVGFGHTTDEVAYAPSGSVTGWTLVGAARNYIEGDDTAGAIGFNSNNAFTPLTNVWMSCSLLRHVGQIATSAEIHVLGFRALVAGNVLQVAFLQSTDNDHFVIRLTEETVTNVIGTGSVELAVDTDFTLLIWQNGTKVRMKVNSTEDDINVSHSGKLDRTGIQGLPTEAGRDSLGTGDKLRIGPIAVHHSNDSADRPGVDIGDDMVVYPNGDDTQEFGDEVDCTEGETTGTYTDVDSWATTTGDETVYVCEHASENGYFLVDLTTVTPANDFTGIRMIARKSANLASKTVANNWVIRDADGSPNTIEKSGANLGTAWVTSSVEFPTEPDGGAWSSGALGVLKAGFTTANTNGANFRCSEMMIEICTIDADAPPATTSRRRAMGQVS